MGHKHKVRHTRWDRGNLMVHEYYVDSLDQAVQLAADLDGLAKVYDESGYLVHEDNSDENRETYA